VNVPVDTTITVVFSEKIDEITLEKALWVTPGGAVKPRIKVSGREATIRLGRAFPESTTVGVLITTVLMDRKRAGQQNRMTRSYRWIFSTGDAVWSGRVHGKVERVGGAVGQGQLLVALYPGDADTVPDALTTEPLAITEADTSGRYELVGVPADGERRWLFGLFDRDGNREIRGPGEFASAEPESVSLTAELPEAVIPLRLVDPNAPGSIQGTLARAEGDTVSIWLELYTAADSLAQPAKRSKASRDGSFAFRQVPPGSYRLIAFCDQDESGRQDPEEIWQGFGLVEVRPGDKHELGEWAGPRCVP
jgi:hypothetical protein